ncbi:hypothetical protein QZH41_010509, partial [Actinostola sp. cb2023]
KVAITEGLFDQIRVDHGKEFYLTLYMQEMLSQFRTNPRRDPHRQTQSKKNLRIERFWVEVNARVNYPIKNALRSMEEVDMIDMDIDETKYCVSAVSLLIAKFGMQQVVESWNYHPIPGVGKPIIVRNANYRVAPITPQLVPTPEDALTRYEASGGHLTAFPVFGTDPLRDNPDLVNIREQQFIDANDIHTIYGCLVNDMDQYFRDAISTYCDLTRRLLANV